MGILWDIYESELFRPQKIQTDEYKQALDRVCKAEDALLNTYPECKDLLLKYQEAESNPVIEVSGSGKQSCSYGHPSDVCDRCQARRKIHAGSNRENRRQIKQAADCI